MQGLAGVDPTEFRAAGQEPLIKFEIDVDGAWINLCDILEQVIDGGFEEWVDAIDLAHWTKAISGGSTVNRESSIIHGGKYSLRYDIDAIKSSVSVRQNITLIPGNAYVLTFWYKGSTSPGTLLHLSLTDRGYGGSPNKWLDSSGDWESMDIYEGGFSRSNQTEWTLCSVAFTAHASYSNYVLRINSCSHGGGVADAQVYIDDLSIVEAGLGAGVSGNYLESVGISLGGASMTPQPVEGTWSATIFNKDGIFHPDHPGPCSGWLTTGRRVRISVGATYGGIDYYWPRITGYMDVPKFTSPDMTVAISGGDYMKRLRETELRRPNNYWGSSQAYDSIASDGTAGDELYVAEDAVDPADDGSPLYDNLADWEEEGCTFLPHAVGGVYVGKYNSIAAFSGAWNETAFNVVEGTKYRCTFRAKRIVGGAGAGVFIAQEVGGTWVPLLVYVAIDSDEWKDYAFYFTAIADGAVMFMLHVITPGEEYWIDNISVYNFIPYWERYYVLNGAFDPLATGPYYVTLNSGDGAGAVPCWQGEGDEDWKYDAAGEGGPDPPFHPPKIVYFNLNKTVPTGGVAPVPANNLVIYYFTATALVDVVARLLYYAGVCDPTTNAPYANEAAAKARIEAQAPIYVDPAINVDMVWFEAGSNCLSAITKICERCDYRFYFKHDGSPIFRPKPTAGIALFKFTDPKHIATISTYQDQNEIKNRIVIKGLKQSETVSKEETMPSQLTGEESDGPSIADYGERTLTINNHLFQDQDSIDHAVTGMCKILLDEYHEPKWYSDLEIPFNPIPLELGDNIQWEEMLSPTRDITQEGIIRDIKIDGYSVTYKCVLK